MRNDMSRWFDEDFSEDTVEEFFAQCQAFTKLAIEKSGIKGFKHLSFNFFEPDTQHAFTPRGVVVSASKSISIWDALLAVASRSYNTNFMISNRKPRKGDGSLLEDFPATVMIPSTVTNVVHHAGYLSKHTWGIEIRNIGKLRPVIGNDRPDPVYPNEETEKFFTTLKRPSKYFWWDNLWREEFDGKVVPYGKYFFEHPMNRQIETLLVLIKILRKVSPIQRELILPLECVLGGEPNLPTIDWHAVREATFSVDSTKYFSKNKLLNNVEKEVSDWSKKEQRDEYFLRELNAKHSHRIGFDNGHIEFLFNEKKLVNVPVNEIRGALQSIGYDPFDVELACRLMTIANGGRIENDMVNTHLARQLVYKRRGLEYKENDDYKFLL